ncbi:uncharacterized protein LOC119130054 isoform X2 [Syngnathus acus]|uniref:uncharacterized protein LOC119130054 isoform X2 n=1 Tax=Syngnathus acus TaxID=161584 RepID=UPI001885BA3B|nr:uncharacterized protein LOC119130054 isoform X2 [Syngnathus acus]
MVPAESREDPTCLKRKFREMCNPQHNKTMERHKFHTRNQKQGETIESFISDLKIKAKSCHFAELTDELICDRIVCGINNDSIRKALLRDSDLTLAKAISICRVYEMTEENTRALTLQVNPVDALQQSSSRGQYRSRNKKANQYDSKNITTCNHCGGSHPAQRDKCPAFGLKCHKCGKMNHFKDCCKSKPAYHNTERKSFTKKSSTRRPVYHMEVEQEKEYTADDDTYYVDGISVDTINAHMKNRDEGFVTLHVHGKPIEMKIDTGAKCNVMAKDMFVQLSEGNIIPCGRSTNLVAYGGSKIETAGLVSLSCYLNEQQHTLPFFLVDSR